MITAVIGNLGVGKTLILVLKAYEGFINQRTIFTNIESLKIPNIYISDVIELGAISEGVAVFDELQLFADSRKWYSFQNTAFNSFIYMSRKRKLDFYYTSAVLMHTDIRIRELTDYIIIPTVIKNNEDIPIAIKINEYDAITFQKIKSSVINLNKKLKPFDEYLYNLYDTHENMGGIMNKKEIFSNTLLNYV